MENNELLVIKPIISPKSAHLVYLTFQIEYQNILPSHVEIPALEDDNMDRLLQSLGVSLKIT